MLFSSVANSLRTFSALMLVVTLVEVKLVLLAGLYLSFVSRLAFSGTFQPACRF